MEDRDRRRWIAYERLIPADSGASESERQQAKERLAELRAKYPRESPHVYVHPVTPGRAPGQATPPRSTRSTWDWIDKERAKRQAEAAENERRAASMRREQAAANARRQAEIHPPGSPPPRVQLADALRDRGYSHRSGSAAWGRPTFTTAVNGREEHARLRTTVLGNFAGDYFNHGSDHIRVLVEFCPTRQINQPVHILLPVIVGEWVSLNFYQPWQTTLDEAIAAVLARYEAHPRCAACNAPMVARVNSRDESTFMGCMDYPTCRGTRVATPSNVYTDPTLEPLR